MTKKLNFSESEEAILMTALTHYYLTELSDMPPSALRIVMAKSLAGACEEIHANLRNPGFNWTNLYDQIMELVQ